MKSIFVERFKNITLASVNKKYKGSQMYRAHKDYLIGLFMKSYVQQVQKKAPKNSVKPYMGDVKVRIISLSEKDIDNDLKLIFDCLQDAGIIENDNQIRMLQKSIANRNTKIKGKDTFFIEVYPLDDKDYDDFNKGMKLLNK